MLLDPHTGFSRDRENGLVRQARHLLKSCPQFVMIHTLKDFSVVSETQVDGFFSERKESRININKMKKRLTKFYLHNQPPTLHKAKNSSLGSQSFFKLVVLLYLCLWQSNIVSAAPFSPW